MNIQHADTTLTINLSNLLVNYHYLRELSQSDCAAVVKANAYGLGIERVAATLEGGGCRHFFVATLDEAIELRTISAGSMIYVFHGVQAGQEELFHHYKLIPVINTVEQLRAWDHYAMSHNEMLPAVLHIDTGMRRLGIPFEQVDDLPIPHAVEIQMIMSHLACADEAEHPLNKEQLQRFDRVKKMFPNIPTSLANSAGIFLGKTYHGDLARPGIALYGSSPTQGNKHQLQTVATITSPIIALQSISAKTAISYGATYISKKAMQIATLPCGYADGYLRSLSNQGFVVIHGKRAPIVGRVTMDLIIVDVTDIVCEIGDSVEIMGKHADIDELAGLAGTIGYELLTRLGNRFKRVYVE